MKMQVGGVLVFLLLPLGFSTAAKLRARSRVRDASVNATSATANLTSAFASLSSEIQPAGQCSLMGGMVLPKVSARCCFSIQVATQRGLAEYDMAEPCKGAWRCQADGVTPEPAFEEQARHEVCTDSTCIAGVQSAMKANWKTAKAAPYMDALCDARTASIAEGTEAGLIRASAEGLESIRRRRRKNGNETKSQGGNQPACFPGESVVQVQGRGPIPIASVRVGDLVLVAKPEVGAPLEYEPLVDWLHVAKGAESSFVTIHHEQGVFRASPGHIVFAASGNLGYDDMPAGLLQKGDVLFAMKDNNLGPSKILSIEYDSVSSGMYAPLTHTGTIVVDGVLASNYATPSLEVRLPHWLAHAGFWPVRMFHSLGFATLLSAVKPMFFGDNELKGPEPEIQDTMHPYCSFLYKGLNAQKLLQTV